MSTTSQTIGAASLPGQPRRSVAEREEIRRQLERILASSVFGTGKRYPAFLRFVVETTLDGNSECLKERTIGVEVFGRATDYETNSDHVVRSAAGEVRRRLAQYYVAANHADEIRIELPLGAYIPQFRFPAGEVAVPDASPGTSQEAQAVPEPRVFIPAGKRIRWVWMVLPAALALLFAFRAPLGLGPSVLDQFWNPVLTSNRPVLICVGSRYGGSSVSPDNDQQNNSRIPDPLMRPVTITDAVTLARLTDYMGKRRASYRILNPEVTTLADLRDAPAVLIGVRNNNWAIKSAGKLRFSFDVNSRPVAIRDSQTPARSWSITPGSPGLESGRDYAIVSRVADPGVEQVIVTVGGLGPNGTLAAGEFVTNEAYMKKLESFSPAGWQGKNLQAVISTEVVGGSSGPPRIETAYFW